MKKHIHNSMLLTFIDPWRFHPCLWAVNPGKSFSYIEGLRRSTSSTPLVYPPKPSYQLRKTHTHTHTHMWFHNLLLHKAKSWRGFYYLPIIIMSCWWSGSISSCVLCLFVYLSPAVLLVSFFFIRFVRLLKFKTEIQPAGASWSFVCFVSVIMLIRVLVLCKNLEHASVNLHIKWLSFTHFYFRNDSLSFEAPRSMTLQQRRMHLW